MRNHGFPGCVINSGFVDDSKEVRQMEKCYFVNLLNVWLLLLEVDEQVDFTVLMVPALLMLSAKLKFNENA